MSHLSIDFNILGELYPVHDVFLSLWWHMSDYSSPCVCVCVCRKHGSGLGGDYPVHEAGGWERCSDTSAGVQQRGNTLLCLDDRLLIVKEPMYCRPSSCHHLCPAVCPVLLLWCRREGQKESKTIILLLCHISVFIKPFLNPPSTRLLHLIHPSPPPLHGLWLVILLYQLSLILSPCLLRQIEPMHSNWITNIPHADLSVTLSALSFAAMEQQIWGRIFTNIMNWLS